MAKFNWFLLTLGMLLSTPAYSETGSASKAASLYESKTTYSIFRKGKKIGNHSLIFTTEDDRVAVTIDSSITVRVLKVPVFKFNYESRETWENDQLRTVSAATTTNRKVETATLKNDGNTSLLTYNGTETQVPLIRFATNHWHIGAVEQSLLFNTIKGTQSKVKVKKATDQTLQIGDTTLSVTQYQYTGDINAQSWYDQNQRWVKLAFLGSDGTQVTYLIDNP